MKRRQRARIRQRHSPVTPVTPSAPDDPPNPHIPALRSGGWGGDHSAIPASADRFLDHLAPLIYQLERDIEKMQADYEISAVIRCRPPRHTGRAARRCTECGALLGAVYATAITCSPRCRVRRHRRLKKAR